MNRDSNNAFNSTPAVGIIFQLADGSIQSCNPEAERILGYTARQLCNADYFTPPWQTIDHNGSLFPPTTHPGIISLKTGKPLSNVIMGFYRANGELVWLSVATQPLFPGNSRQPHGVIISFIETSEIQTPEVAALATKPILAEEEESQRLILLLIEDNPLDREIYRRYLQRDSEHQYTFIEAESGESALEICQTTRLDLILLDYLLPDMDGLEWLNLWQQQPSNTRPPIIALTGQGDERIAVQFLKLGVADYLTKSQLTPEKLSLEVNRAIAEHRLRIQHQETLLKLQLATNAAEMGLWFWDIVNQKLEWTQQCKTVFGLSADTEIDYHLFLERLHPEDRDLVDTAVRQVLRDGLEYNIEYRTIWPDGSVHWIAAKGKGFYNQNGEPVRMMGTAQDISDRKQIEETIRNSERHLRRVLDGLFSFVGVMTPDGILIEANRTALEAANLQPEDVIPRPFAETYWWSYDPQIQAQLNDAIQESATGEQVRYDVRVRLDRDKYILIDFSLIPLFDSDGRVEYLIPSGIDVSDREASKQALKESEDQLRLITEVIPQQIWTALPNGQLDYINQRWEEFTGIPLAQIQKQGWEAIVHPEDLERVKQIWAEAIKSGKKYDMEARLLRSDGIYSWFLGRARPLRNAEGKIIKWYGTNTDITLIKELEEKLRQQTEDLTRANRLKDEFLAIVSHELRTPLNPILGWSQLIGAGRLDAEKTAQGIETIQRNAKLQAQLIDDLLDVSRILRGKLDLKVTPINLESIIESALATVQLSAEAKSIQITTEFEPNIGQISGDAGRLQQIVWNLLSNAIKFTSEGGKVTVKLKQVGTQAQIQVQDTGQGIDPKFLPFVFDRFRQGESATTRKFGGLGLGLAIVRHLTEIHGGTVSVTSQGEDRGATFSVKLPLIKTSSTKVSETESSERAVLPNRFKGIRILAIDDEADSRDLLTFVLQQQEAEVISVASAQEALAALNDDSFSLIISDIGMPEMDGYTLMTQIRALPQGKNIPAIALSAYAGEIDRQRSLNVGFQRHISKPINMSEFLDIIAQLVSSTEGTLNIEH